MDTQSYYLHVHESTNVLPHLGHGHRPLAAMLIEMFSGLVVMDLQALIVIIAAAGQSSTVTITASASAANEASACDSE